jgi:hypothetical protein
MLFVIFSIMGVSSLKQHGLLHFGSNEVADSCGGCEYLTLGPVPVDLTRGGTRKITLNVLDRGACVDTYTAYGDYIGTSCQGRFDDWRGQGVALVAASNQDRVHVKVTTWR